MTTTKSEITQDRISQLANTITSRLRDSINDIQSVNDDIHVLSINAKILAAKAGASGKAFAVVADSVRGMAGRTQKITNTLQTSVEATVGELMAINSFLGTKVRADRLSQVADNMIDIVDRNLYERSCDVRWWATESAVTAAAEDTTEENKRNCGARLGVILDSYTVYLDIVACGLDGTVIANGRPERYASAGRSVANTAWFASAVKTASGNEYGFEGVHASGLADGANVLVYSCGIRQGGQTTGKLTGVLGVIFNWDGLGKVVASRAKEMLAPETDKTVRAFLVYTDGTIVASSEDQAKRERIPEMVMGAVRSAPRGTLLPDQNARDGVIAGYAASKGFETYRTGWYAIIEEDAYGERR
jgi:hypothetical protein